MTRHVPARVTIISWTLHIPARFPLKSLFALALARPVVTQTSVRAQGIAVGDVKAGGVVAPRSALAWWAVCSEWG